MLCLRRSGGVELQWRVPLPDGGGARGGGEEGATLDAGRQAAHRRFRLRMYVKSACVCLSVGGSIQSVDISLLS